MTQTSATQQGSEQAADKNAIRPFHVNVPEAELTELRRRIKATRWPEKETVADTSQGVPLAPLQDLARYWATDYDWRKCEAKLNALPQFITEIDGLDIHFIHVRSKHKGALPRHRHARMARLDPRADQAHRPAHRPHGLRRPRGGRLRRRDPVDPRLWVLGQADGDRLGSCPHRARLDRADEAPGIHAIRRAGRRRGRTDHGRHGGRGARGARGHAHQLPVRPPGGRVERDSSPEAPAPSDLSDLERRAFDKLKGFFAKNAAYAFEMATRRRRSTDSPIRRSASRPG